MPIPEIRSENNVSTLYVDGKPFLSLGGELHNSSASSTAYMREKVWPALRPLNINSVIATVAWEQIEPREGSFDFSLVDDLISDAKKEGVRLILIWFGLWKNGESSYVPGWVKRDPRRYWKCVHAKANRVSQFGEIGLQTISPLCNAAVEADARAYTQLMRHIREVDTDYTVILMQVENEIGLIGSARDFSEEANRLFAGEIPSKVAEAFSVKGDWKSAFGDDAEEYFMAWHYAKAVETIASAGKQEHPLPVYVNAWLQQHPDRAGSYPSGGPIAKMIKLWKLAAPSICLYAPDIYLPDFEAVACEYAQSGNPLFIPETRSSASSAASVFLAVGKYNALGFHPFGIEDIFGDTTRRLELAELAALNIDVSAFTYEGSEQFLPLSYKLLLNMWHIIQKYRGTTHMTGFYQYGDAGGCTLQFTSYDARVTYNRRASTGTPPAGGILIETGEEEFILAGMNCRVEFLPKKGEEKYVDFITIQEGEYAEGAWVPGRILNGDERRLSLGAYPQVLQVELYKR